MTWGAHGAKSSLLLTILSLMCVCLYLQQNEFGSAKSEYTFFLMFTVGVEGTWICIGEFILGLLYTAVCVPGMPMIRWYHCWGAYIQVDVTKPGNTVGHTYAHMHTHVLVHTRLIPKWNLAYSYWCSRVLVHSTSPDIKFGIFPLLKKKWHLKFLDFFFFPESYITTTLEVAQCAKFHFPR